MKKFLIKTLIIFFIIIIIFNNAYAASIVVTEESLKNAWKEISKELNPSGDNAPTMTINKEKKTIIFSSAEETYTVNYDLTDKPTFSTDVTLDLNMDYKKLSDEYESFAGPLLSYVLVCRIAGIDAVDSIFYFESCMLDTMNKISDTFSTLSETSIEDLENQDDVVYEDDTFKYIFKIIPETDTKFKYEMIIEMNPEGDFSVMKGASDEFVKSMEELSNSILEASKKVVEESTQATKELADKANNARSSANALTSTSTTSNKVINKLPQTGRLLTLKDSLYALIFLSFIAIFILLFSDYRYKNINRK